MTITLPPELQTTLQTIADQRGEDINTIVIALLTQSLNPTSPEAIGYSRNFLRTPRTPLQQRELDFCADTL